MSLIGMEFYAWRVYDKEGNTLRINFNNILNGMTTIFILLINEDWNTIMIEYI